MKSRRAYNKKNRKKSSSLCYENSLFFYNSFITFSTFLFSHDKKKRETFFFSCHIFLSLCQFYVFSVYNHEKAICYFHYVFSCLFIFLLFFVHIFFPDAFSSALLQQRRSSGGSLDSGLVCILRQSSIVTNLVFWLFF